MVETDSYYACYFLFYFSNFAASVKEVQSIVVSDVLSVDGRLGRLRWHTISQPMGKNC